MRQTCNPVYQYSIKVSLDLLMDRIFANHCDVQLHAGGVGWGVGVVFVVAFGLVCFFKWPLSRLVGCFQLPVV